MNAPLRPADVEEPLAAAEHAFRSGELSDCAALLARMEGGVPEDETTRRRHDFLLFGLAAYGLGDAGAALRRHEALGPEASPALRYRMLVEMGELGAARRLRRAADHPPAVLADFRWTLSRAALWSHRLDRGLRLYDARSAAQNFTRILPRWIRHAPEIADQDRPAAVVLEQGFGDVLFHIGQMRACGAAPRLILGQPREAALAKAIWPDAAFRDLGASPPEETPLDAACSGDWLRRRWLRDHALGPVAPIRRLRSGENARQGVGLCWRGGSGQNRREQRCIPLQFFLDRLPRGGAYVALQHDITEAERALLRTRPDIVTPTIDLTEDDLATLRMVSRLRGVISVDSANLHLAGAVGIPALALMNARSHWYWGRDGRVESVYRRTTTVPIDGFGRDDVAAWLERLAPPPQRAPSPPARGRAKEAARPIFVTGAPRSRTSMVAGALAAGGLSFGPTIGATKDNPRGFFENRRLREEVLKPLLRSGGFDPAGVRDLPPLGWAPAAPLLREAVLSRLELPSGGGENGWGYKDPKLLLAWRAWDAAFPEAIWVVVDRPPGAIAESCARTPFMNRHSRSEAFWRQFAESYRARADDLAAARPGRVLRVSSDDLAEQGAFAVTSAGGAHRFTLPKAERGNLIAG